MLNTALMSAFVVRDGPRLTAIEVKSGRIRGSQSGLTAFNQAFGPDRALLVGGDGISVEEFLSEPVRHWVGP